MVTFVGIHFKPGKTALDSTTPSGRKVDKVIQALGCECRKCNLFSTTYIPAWGDEYSDELMRFINEVPAGKGDVVVLLGKEVQKHFPGSYFRHAKVIKYRHPSFSSPDWSMELAEVIRSK